MCSIQTPESLVSSFRYFEGAKCIMHIVERSRFPQTDPPCCQGWEGRLLAALANISM